MQQGVFIIVCTPQLPFSGRGTNGVVELLRARLFVVCLSYSVSLASLGLAVYPKVASIL